MSQRSLCFFTQSYPYGTGEAFIENELYVIAPYFETVYLFCHHKSAEHRMVPANVKVIHIPHDAGRSKKGILNVNLFFLIYMICYEALFSRQKKLFLKKFRYNVRHLLNCIHYSQQLKEHLNSEVLKTASFYSYWFSDWNLSLSILKHKKIISNLMTRAHGFDIYENNGQPNYIPFRKFCLEHTDKVITVSELGKHYLQDLYPHYSGRIFTSYLGTHDGGLNPVPDAAMPVHIVSCANTNSVKRIHLIVEALSQVKRAVVWTHIGDGKLQELVMKKAEGLPPHIKVDFKGKQQPKDIFFFYSSIPVDFFINCSISEGLPVSIMEAISFGIPVIATNVGGTNEIVNQTTGILIDRDFETPVLTDLIEQARAKQFDRPKIKEYWAKHFHAKTNYQDFVKHLIR